MSEYIISNYPYKDKRRLMNKQELQDLKRGLNRNNNFIYVEHMILKRNYIEYKNNIYLLKQILYKLQDKRTGENRMDILLDIYA